jgi:hypothetical protein
MEQQQHPTPWSREWCTSPISACAAAIGPKSRIVDAAGACVLEVLTGGGAADAELAARIVAAVNASDPLLSRATEAARRWVIRQQVRTARKAWMVDLGECHSERVARDDYERLVRELPESYFELVEVVHVETCLAFTPFKGAGC